MSGFLDMSATYIKHSSAHSVYTTISGNYLRMAVLQSQSAVFFWQRRCCPALKYPKNDSNSLSSAADVGFLDTVHKQPGETHTSLSLSYNTGI